MAVAVMASITLLFAAVSHNQVELKRLPVTSTPARVDVPTPASLNPNTPAFEAPSSSSSTLYIGTDKTTLLQTAQVLLYNPLKTDTTVTVRAVLDTGSQRSYTTARVKRALNLDCDEVQPLSIATFGATGHEVQKLQVLRVGLKLKDGETLELKLINMPSICEPLTAQPISLCLKKYNHLNHLDLADWSSGVEALHIDVLIGADYYWELVTGKTLRGTEGPVAVDTRLGWVLSGPAPKAKQSKNSASLLTTHSLHVGALEDNSQVLNQTLQSFWELESLEIKQPDRCVFTEFEEKIQYKGGRYEVSLPWRDVHPDNYQLALKRLKGLQRRLQQQPTLLHDYNAIIQDQIEQSVVELVDGGESSDGHPTHYLPHHAVVRQGR